MQVPAFLFFDGGAMVSAEGISVGVLGREHWRREGLGSAGGGLRVGILGQSSGCARWGSLVYQRGCAQAALTAHCTSLCGIPPTGQHKANRVRGPGQHQADRVRGPGGGQRGFGAARK